MAYVIKTEDHSVPGFRWVSLKRLQYCDAKGHKRTWEMAERIQRRTASEGPPPANGVGIVAIISTALEKDNDHIVLGKEGKREGGGEGREGGRSASEGPRLRMEWGLWRSFPRRWRRIMIILS